MQSEHIVDIKTSVLYVNGMPSLVTLDYLMDIDGAQKRCNTDSEVAKKGRVEGQDRRYGLLCGSCKSVDTVGSHIA